MAKNLYSLSPERLPKKKAQDITAGAASISSTPSRNRREESTTTKSTATIGKKVTNNPITDKILNMARAKGIDKDTLIKMQREADIYELKEDMGTYRDTKKKQASYGNLDMGVEEVVDTGKKDAEKQKKQLMTRYGVSSADFDKSYKEYDNAKTREELRKKNEKSKAYAKAHPVLGSLSSVGKKLLTPFEGIANEVASLQGGNLDTEKDFVMSNSANASREGAKDNIKSDIGKTAYDIGMSGADMLAQLAVGAATGGGSTLMGAMQGSQTANDMMKQSIDNGNSSLQAGVTGLASGALGALMAKGGLDVATSKIKPRNIAQNVAKGTVVEGLEETLENVADNLIDKGASKLFGGTSNEEASINRYINQGMTTEEAKNQYSSDRKRELLTDALAGGLFGGIAGGVEGVKLNNSLNNAQSGKVNSVVKDLINGKPNAQPTVENGIQPIEENNINTVNEQVIENAVEPKVENTVNEPINQPNVDNVIPNINQEPINNVNNQKVKNNKPNENIEYGTINLNENVEPTPNVQNVEQTTNGTKAPNNFLNQNNDIDYDPQIGDGNIRNRGYYDSVDLPKEFKEQLNEKTYRQLTNASTIEKANETLNSTSDLWELKDKYTKLLNEQDASSAVVGYELAKRFIDEGRQDIAVDIVDELSKSMTRAGQFTQAAYITALRNDPIAVLYAMNKEINKINEVGAKKFKDWQDFKLTDEEVSALNNVAPGDTKAIQDITDSIYSRIAAEHPHTKWEKFYDLTKTFMLFNPRTHIRNITANAISQPVRSATDRVKAALEIGYQLFDKNYKRTSSLIGGNKITDKIANDVFENAVRSDLELNGGKYEESGLSRVQRESPLWKDNKVIGEQTSKVTQELAKKTTNVLNALDRVTGGYLNEKTGIVDSMRDFSENQVTGSTLENLRRFNYLLLGEIEDTPFVKQNFVNSLSNYLAANNITSIDDVPQEAINLAYDEALKATFKDDNALSNTLSTLKKKMGKFGDVILPFTKTPANLAMRGLEYSPAGFVKTFNDFANTKKTNKGTMTNADISRFLGDLSKNITGSGMILLGYSLAKSGIITGGYSEDKNERNWQKLKGYQPNAFHIGNKYYTYDWAQPSSIPLIIGTAIYEGINKMEKEEASEFEALTQGAKSLGQGLINASDAWFNLSPLQNVANILGGGENASYGNSSPATNILKTLAEYPQTLIPAVSGATARTNDTTIRNTYDSTSYANTYVNKMKSKIPGLSKTLPASYDVWGEERKRGTDEDAFVSQFINPGTLGYYNEANRDVDNYIDGLYESIKGNENLKDTQVLPRQASNKVTINGEEKKLNNVEYSLRQKTLGEKQKELVRAFSKVADGLTPEEQAKALDKIYSAANIDTNSKLYGIESDMGKEAKEHFDKGADDYARYLKESALTAREKAKEEAFINKINEEIGTDISASTYKTYKERVPSLTNNDIKAVETLKSKYDLSSQSKKITALANINATDEEKSRYLRMMLSDSSLDAGYVKRGIETLGEENLYNIYLYKAIATKYDGKDNNSLSKKEIEAFVTDNFDTKEEQDTWRYILSNPKK